MVNLPSKAKLLVVLRIRVDKSAEEEEEEEGDTYTGRDLNNFLKYKINSGGGCRLCTRGGVVALDGAVRSRGHHYERQNGPLSLLRF